MRRERPAPKSPSKRFALLVGLALGGVAAGAVGTAAFDGSDVRDARVALGGEGLAPILDLFGAWVATLQNAKSPLDLAVPELVEGSLGEQLRKSSAERELRHFEWLDRFAASEHVRPEIRAQVKAACWDQRARDPIACHRCACDVLSEMERAERLEQRACEWLSGASALGLLGLFGWRVRERRRATAPE